MNQLEKDNNNTIPAALSILTGLPVGDCVMELRKHLGDQPISGVFIPVAIQVLESLGYSVERNDFLDNVTLGIAGKHRIVRITIEVEYVQ